MPSACFAPRGAWVALARSSQPGSASEQRAAVRNGPWARLPSPRLVGEGEIHDEGAERQPEIPVVRLGRVESEQREHAPDLRRSRIVLARVEAVSERAQLSEERTARVRAGAAHGEGAAASISELS